MTKEEQDKLSLSYAVDTRKFEIGLFWQRSLFFWGFIGAAFISFGALRSDTDLALPIACFGLICSLAWTLSNRGSKRWQEVWEQKVANLEKEVLERPLFADKGTNRPSRWWGPHRYSVTRLAIALSDFTVAIWLVLVVKAYPLVGLTAWACLKPTILAGTFIYAISMLLLARSAK